MARTLLDSSEQDLARHVLIQATRRRDAIIANGDLGLISLARLQRTVACRSSGPQGRRPRS